MPTPRPLPRIRAGLRPLDLKRLAARTAFLNAEDAAPAPSPDADLPTLTRWSIAPLGEVAQLLALDDWGHVVCLSVIAYASDGTWAQRVDGSYVRLAEPWPLPLAAPGGAK